MQLGAQVAICIFWVHDPSSACNSLALWVFRVILLHGFLCSNGSGKLDDTTQSTTTHSQSLFDAERIL